MSHDTNKTIRTGLWILGGLVAVTTVAGLAIFAVGSKAVMNVANQVGSAAPGQVALTGSGGLPLLPGRLYVVTYVGGPINTLGPTEWPTQAQAQAALDAALPGIFSVQQVQGSEQWRASGSFNVSVTVNGPNGLVVKSQQLLSGWASVQGLQMVSSGPAFAVWLVQDFGSV